MIKINSIQKSNVIFFFAGIILSLTVIFFSFRESNSNNDVRSFVRRETELSNLCDNLDRSNRKLLQLILFKSQTGPVVIDSATANPAVRISEMRIDFISFLRIERGNLVGNVEGLGSPAGDTLRMNLFQNPFDKDKTGKFLFGNNAADSNSCAVHQLKEKFAAFEKQAYKMTQSQNGSSDLPPVPAKLYDFSSGKFVSWENYRFKNCSLAEAVVALKETEMDCLVTENYVLASLLKKKYAPHN